MTATPMPSVFVGHGSPMNTLEHNRYTQAWNEFGNRVGTPRAILAISAHWYINATAVTAMVNPPTIHDFYGFPQELFDIQYPAPGMPELADQIIELVKPTWVGRDTDSWGLDHGTWSVLAHMFPKANVPVVQLSIDASKDFEYHIDLGRKLATLREQGVLIVASGNVVHNLGRIDWGATDSGYDWNVSFDQETRRIMKENPASVGTLLQHPSYALASPTPDHYIPLLYIAGIADALNKGAEVLVGGYQLGSLSMTAFEV